ncbi:hypothetical protein TYRP_005702 [Tyrophagus putrescentiae]|nr:hypothetical protein TYRP_005702 [Tyrophagus putrescentiae]
MLTYLAIRAESALLSLFLLQHYLLPVTFTDAVSALNFQVFSEGYHFPDCRDTANIRRVFNLFEMTLLEEKIITGLSGNVSSSSSSSGGGDKDKDIFAYYIWDARLKTFIKADWLLSLVSEQQAKNIAFRGVIWSADGASSSSASESSLFTLHTFTLLFYGPPTTASSAIPSWQTLTVRYNVDPGLFHLIDLKLKPMKPPLPPSSSSPTDDTPSDNPSYQVEANQVWVYQTAAADPSSGVFYYDEASRRLSQPPVEGGDSQEVLPAPLRGIFKASSLFNASLFFPKSSEPKLYYYYNSKHIEEVVVVGGTADNQSTSGGSKKTKKTKKKVLSFVDVLPCYLEAEVNWKLAGGVAGQVVLVVLLIAVNGRMANWWLASGGGGRRMVSSGYRFSDPRMDSGGVVEDVVAVVEVVEVVVEEAVEVFLLAETLVIKQEPELPALLILQEEKLQEKEEEEKEEEALEKGKENEEEEEEEDIQRR